MVRAIMALLALQPAFSPSSPRAEPDWAEASGGFVSQFITAVASGTVTPVALQTCTLLPAQIRPAVQRCNATGSWTYSRYGSKTSYPFVEDSAGVLRVTSSYPGDPWTHASGTVRLGGGGGTAVPATCAGGMVSPLPNKNPDVTIHFNCTKGHQPTIITHVGTFSADCNTISMDDGWAYLRVGADPTPTIDAADPPPPPCQVAPLKLEAAPIEWRPGSRPGWRQFPVSYTLVGGAGAHKGISLVHINVLLEADSANTTVRISSNLSALTDLPFCLGGLAILKLSVPDGGKSTILHGSSGGPAGAGTALQPWSCELATASSAQGQHCQATAGTPARPFENPNSTVAEVDSGLDGRSSNFQLPIHSIELGGGQNASSSHGVWMAPEYSGIWRMDAYSADGSEDYTGAAGHNTFYWSLPSFLFTMKQSETIQLPWASFGIWDANGGASDWANSVRLAMATHYTQNVSGARVKPLAVYQGLGALPSYQTEDVLYETTSRVERFGVEAFIFDAGTYTSCQPSSVCNGTAVWSNKCCEPQGNWWTEQGDYMPRDTRFPEHGFMALEKAITAQIPQYGIWITPQAAPGSPVLKNNSHLYLAPKTSARGFSESYLLNLLLPEAQDLFFGQFVEMIETFNCSRIWFDYNTPSRRTHWNEHELPDRQGLLERGFYEGLYNVFDRTRAQYPNVWIEGCASGGRMMDLGSLTRVQSMWINDDSVSDDRNRRLRLGANHMLPAHYLQNAFLPIGCGVTGGHSPLAPLMVDPQRLLTYFNGVLQFGQGVSTWDESSLAGATAAVQVYKAHRHLMDPLTSNYYRLFERPANGTAIRNIDVSTAVGWIYEEPSTRSGLLYLMRQSACNQSTISVAMVRGSAENQWPWAVPAPLLVREGGSAATASFKLLSSCKGVTGSVEDDLFVAHFATVDTQALWSYSF